jgi:2-aminoadipate transaminase
VLEKINLGKAATDLCTSTLSQLLVSAYFEEARWRAYVDSLTEVYRARRDTMLDALAEFFPQEAEWTRPAGGLFIWVTLPDFIDTTDLLARALRENVAFVPGEGAYLDGRGRSSMRLNFSGSHEDAVREGVRRIGKVVSEQVALYGTLTGRGRADARTEGRTGRASGRQARPRPEAEEPGAAEASATEGAERGPGGAEDVAERGDEDLARVVPMRRRSGPA